MNDKIYTLNDISRLILPVAEKYVINSIYIFGSYARGSANENSDIDLLIDLEGAHITGLFGLGALYSDLESALNKPIDMVTLGGLMQENKTDPNAEFRENVLNEMITIYQAA